MYDHLGQADSRGRALPLPVEVLGLDELPDVGDAFQVVTDTAKAKQIVMYREAKSREQAMSQGRAHHARAASTSRRRKARSRNSTSSSRRTSAARRKCSARCCRSSRPTRSRSACITKNVGAINESRRAAGVRVERDHHRLQRPAGAQRRGAGREGKGRYPSAHDHLRADGRDQEGHGGHARPGLQGSLQRPCGGPRGVPDLEGRRRGGLL